MLAPLALLKGRAQKTAARVALVIAGLSVLGFLLQAFPTLDQVNGEIIALFAPVHVAAAVATIEIATNTSQRALRNEHTATNTTP